MQHLGNAPLSGHPLTLSKRADRASVVDTAVLELHREAVRHIARQRLSERERAFRKLACDDALAWIEKMEREVPQASPRAGD
jgi:hypothetical protein